MNTFRKRLFSAAGVLLAASIAAYWYWSPYLVMHQMRSAARSADADSFNDHVDYPQLRDSLKGQLSARMTEELASHPGSGNALEQAGTVLGSILGLALVDRMVDAVVRPDMLMRAMENGKFQLRDGSAQERDRLPPPDAADAPAKPGVAWHIERKGTDKVFIHVDRDASKSKKSGTTLVMRRAGFANWKLTEIRLPE